MNNLKFVVGKQYKLVDTSASSEHLQAVIDIGFLAFPSDNVFTCHTVDEDGDCRSCTEGVLFLGVAGITEEPIMCATKADLNAGVFVEVTDGES